MRTKLLFIAGALLTLPAVASAHAFGQQYTLPLPFQFYALGASCALIASFVFLMLYSTPERSSPFIPKRFTIQQSGIIEIILRGIGIIGFAGTLICAFWGAQDFTLNPVPELFWAILLLGFTYLSVFIGDLWRFVSPFETLARILFAKRPEPLMEYPEELGYVPAIVFYYALIWFELLSNGAGAIPSNIGAVLVGYAAVSLIGAGIFGIDEWFTYGDFFTVFFGLIGRFAPIQLEKRFLNVQPFAERLIVEEAESKSILVFILFMLASTAFDGLQDTQIWWNTLYHSLIQIYFYNIERLAIFIASPFIFLALYALAMYLMKLLTGTRERIVVLLLRFAYSLIPIAIAYNFAHYFTLLINSIQALFAIVSDPLGKGWDIFGTAHYVVNIGLIGAKEVWYAQFSAIVIGHILATYVAHRIAMREFPTRREIMLGQIPILILMVFYTVFGLWILAQGYQNG
jgi:hypothetical protein